MGHVTSNLPCFLSSCSFLRMQDPDPCHSPSSIRACTQGVSCEAHGQIWSAATGFCWALLSMGQLCISTCAGHCHSHRALCLLSTSTTFRHRAPQSLSVNTCLPTEAPLIPWNFWSTNTWQLAAQLEGIAVFVLPQAFPPSVAGRRFFHFLFKVLFPWGNRIV